MKKLLLLPFLLGIHQVGPKEELPKRAIFQEEVLNTLAFVYDGLGRELPLCMKGLKVDNTYIIFDIEIPYYLESQDSTATFDSASCKSPNYVGVVHNHHRGECRPSLGDIQRFENDEDAELETVVCKGVKRDGEGVDLFTLTKDTLESYKRKWGMK